MKMFVPPQKTTNLNEGWSLIKKNFLMKEEVSMVTYDLYYNSLNIKLQLFFNT